MKDLKRITRLSKTILTAKEVKAIKIHEERAECGKNETYFHFFREILNTSSYGVASIEWYLEASDELLLNTLKEVKENKIEILSKMEVI